MSEQGKIMEHCRAIHNALDLLVWNSLDLERCRQVKAAQQSVKELMCQVDKIPSVKHKDIRAWYLDGCTRDKVLRRIRNTTTIFPERNKR